MERRLNVAEDRLDRYEDEPGSDDMSTFAGRLTYLFRAVHPRGRQPYSYDYVAEAITRDQQVDISANYIWMLRTGRRDNPTLRHMEALARFFGVRPAFLTDAEEAQRVKAQLDTMSDLVANGVQHISMRGVAADASTLQVIHSLLDQVRELTAGLGGDNSDAPPASPQNSEAPE